MMPSVAILAGGLATRMRPLTINTPKALLPVRGEPFIFHQLDQLQRQRISKVVICIGHLGEKVKTEVGRHSGRWPMEILFSEDGSSQLGTGGAIKKAMRLIGCDLMVLYGDSWLTIDFNSVWTVFKTASKKALMTVFENADQWDRSNACYQNGHVIIYDKQNITSKMKHIDYGLGCIKYDSFKTWPDIFDLADFYSQMARSGQLAGYETKCRFYEIGSMSGYQELNNLFKSFNPLEDKK